MSGRLVISRHKSWHVWNQDNQEKVLRDERIHREKQEKEQEHEHRAIREQQRDILLQTTMSSTEAADESNTAVAAKRFSLFEEPMADEINGIIAGKRNQHENEEYVRERSDKEKKRLKQEGVAPMAFSDVATNVPWYASAPSSDIQNESNVKVESESRQQEPKEAATKESIIESKENQRKRKQDPANAFSLLGSSSSRNASNKNAVVKQSTTTTAMTKASLTMNEMELKASNDPLDVLRRKRLERERVERQKTLLLLMESSPTAKAIALSPQRSYNQQYHPSISRK